MPRRPDHPELVYALHVLAALWPSSHGPSVTRQPFRFPSGSGTREWLVLPRLSRPRVLVPSGVPGAAQMLRRHSSARLQRLTWNVLAVGVRTRALTVLPAPRVRVTLPVGPAAAGDTVESLLSQSLGDRLSVGVLLGTPRANRKPVLAVYGAGGAPVAFVKVGIDDLTRALVTREADNLRDLARRGLRTIEPPRVLAFEALGDLRLLVLAPLHASARKRWSGPPPLAAMAELARSGGTAEMPLRTSDFWRRVAGATAAASDTVVGERLRTRAEAVAALAGDLSFEFGSWHGDWSPWNMGWLDGRVQLWDWERFESDVPCGFDALHYEAQRVRQGSPELTAAQASFVARVPGLLSEVGVDEKRSLPTLALYLLAVAVRYLGSHTAETLTPHPRGVWALDLLDELIVRLRHA